MQLKIEEIDIGERLRHETGDLTQLKESIEKVGLLNPIIVNEHSELLSGFRRLEACRELGWSEIDVRLVETESDEVKKLDYEYHENLGRVDLSVDEATRYREKREVLVAPPKPQSRLLTWLKHLWQMIKAFFVGHLKSASRSEREEEGTETMGKDVK